jgi:hypothetical protein
MKRFISRADLTKDFERKIMTMTRLMTRSYLSDERKKPEKEFLVYHEEWVGKNWLGEKLVCSDNFEGVYTEVTRHRKSSSSQLNRLLLVCRP